MGLLGPKYLFQPLLGSIGVGEITSEPLLVLILEGSYSMPNHHGMRSDMARFLFSSQSYCLVPGHGG